MTTNSLNRPSWDEYFIKMAEIASTRSPDPNKQVGAILVSKRNRLLSQGYNGLPEKINEDNIDWTDRILFKNI